MKTSESIRILGIDPGSRKTGFGVVDFHFERRQITHVASGVLRLDVDQELPARITELSFRLQKVLADHRPYKVVLEDIFLSENARSALILGQARGAVLATVGMAGVEVVSFSSTSVKLAVTGTGRASKLQVAEMVRLLLSLEKKPAEDAADALALAISYGQRFMGSLGVEAHKMPKPKALSKKQKQQALYSLALAQGKL